MASEEVLVMATKAKTAKAPGRKNLTGPALRTFFRIAEAWGLKEQEQMRLLGLDNRSTFQSWKRGDVAAISKDALERISYVLGIYKGLHLLFADDMADRWPRLSNKGPLFGRLSPIDSMLKGGIPQMLDVRRYVDAVRGGL